MAQDFDHGVRRERLREMFEALTDEQLATLKNRQGKRLTDDARGRYVRGGTGGREVPACVLSQVVAMVADRYQVGAGELFTWVHGMADGVVLERGVR